MKSLKSIRLLLLKQNKNVKFCKIQKDILKKPRILYNRIIIITDIKQFTKWNSDILNSESYKIINKSKQNKIEKQANKIVNTVCKTAEKRA